MKKPTKKKVRNRSSNDAWVTEIFKDLEEIADDLSWLSHFIYWNLNLFRQNKKK